MTLRGTPGPYGAPYDDGSDPRWSDDFLAIVQPHPDLLEHALGLLSSGWDMGARAKPGPPPKSGNPFWGLDTEAADVQLSTTQPANARSLLMSDALAVLPPKVRAAIYLLLIVANAVVTPLMAAGVIPSLYGTVILSLLNVFGGATALANVRRDPDAAVAVAYNAKRDDE